MIARPIAWSARNPVLVLVGIMVLGTELTEMEKVARQVEAVVKAVPGTFQRLCRAGAGRHVLDINPDREVLGRYGLMVGDVQDVIAWRSAARA